MGEISKSNLLNRLFDSVDTCTGLLPERKPRYVMGVVSSGPGSPVLALALTSAAGISGRPCRIRRSGSRHV
jgi:hypothetical protein